MVTIHRVAPSLRAAKRWKLRDLWRPFRERCRCRRPRRRIDETVWASSNCYRGHFTRIFPARAVTASSERGRSSCGALHFHPLNDAMDNFLRNAARDPGPARTCSPAEVTAQHTTHLECLRLRQRFDTLVDGKIAPTAPESPNGKDLPRLLVRKRRSRPYRGLRYIHRHADPRLGGANCGASIIMRRVAGCDALCPRAGTPCAEHLYRDLGRVVAEDK